MNANPTTGYTWINNVDTSSHVEVTEDTFQQSENKNHLLGVGGQEYITIQANESGQFVFKAIQARPWQFDKTIFGDEHLFDGTYDVAVKINIAWVINNLKLWQIHSIAVLKKKVNRNRNTS